MSTVHVQVHSNVDIYMRSMAYGTNKHDAATSVNVGKQVIGEGSPRKESTASATGESVLLTV